MLPRAQDWSYRRRRPGPCGSGPRDGPPRLPWPRWRLRGRADGAARAAGLSGDQQQIADYLLEEVLERQPDHLKKFLLGTSILDHMTAPLCDAVLGTTAAAGSLEDLARSNAFIVSLDDQRECYRYHHLFGDLLPCGAQAAPPGTAPLIPPTSSTLVRGAWIAWRGVRLRASGRRSRSRRPHRACVPGRVGKPRADRKPPTVARPLHRRRHRVRTRSCPSPPRGSSGISASRPAPAVLSRRRADSARPGIR